MSAAMNSNELVDRLMAVLDAGVSQPGDHPADQVLALAECIARILILRLGDDPITARAIADSLTQRLIARIAEGSVSRSEFLN